MQTEKHGHTVKPARTYIENIHGNRDDGREREREREGRVRFRGPAALETG